MTRKYITIIKTISIVNLFIDEVDDVCFTYVDVLPSKERITPMVKDTQKYSLLLEKSCYEWDIPL